MSVIVSGNTQSSTSNTSNNSNSVLKNLLMAGEDNVNGYYCKKVYKTMLPLHLKYIIKSQEYLVIVLYTTLW